MKISIIVGTRPEIIKMAPLIRECEKRRLDYFILHTGQHYSYEMDRIFFEQLELPQPRYNLETCSGSHAKQTAKILTGIEEVLIREEPDIVLIQGDTNTVLAGALAAAKLHIKVGHVEAGLRSFDRNMPEEINRIVADHVSDYQFAPTEEARNNLLREGFSIKNLFVTGNTIVDSVHQSLKIAKRKVKILDDLGLKPGSYFLITAHREENVDNKKRLSNIIEGLEMIRDEFSMPIIFPMHPRTRKRIKEFGFDLNGTTVIDPVGFLDFLQLETNSSAVLTDSGGIQEEACIIGVPCITLRENTERPETVGVGSNMLVGTQPKDILGGVRLMLESNNRWENPFGDGRAGEKIIQIVDGIS